MDKCLKGFALLSTILVTGLLVVLVAFGLIYHYSTIYIYNLILLVLIAIMALIVLLCIVSILSIVHIYKHGSGSKMMRAAAKSGIKVILPVALFFAESFKTKKDLVRKFYIDFNNIMVNELGEKYLPENVLILLPHCLQNSECGYKITNNTDNCKRCGRCTIGNILKVAQERKVTVKIVTGGTAARNVIKECRPKLVLAVACERDLTSGIAEVDRIPVIGLLNARPNGPCYNTTIDVEALKQKLDSVIQTSECKIDALRL